MRNVNNGKWCNQHIVNGQNISRIVYESVYSISAGDVKWRAKEIRWFNNVCMCVCAKSDTPKNEKWCERDCFVVVCLSPQRNGKFTWQYTTADSIAFGNATPQFQSNFKRILMLDQCAIIIIIIIVSISFLCRSQCSTSYAMKHFITNSTSNHKQFKSIQIVWRSSLPHLFARNDSSPNESSFKM